MASSFLEPAHSSHCHLEHAQPTQVVFCWTLWISQNGPWLHQHLNLNHLTKPWTCRSFGLGMPWAMSSWSLDELLLWRWQRQMYRRPSMYWLHLGWRNYPHSWSPSSWRWQWESLLSSIGMKTNRAKAVWLWKQSKRSEGPFEVARASIWLATSFHMLT